MAEGVVVNPTFENATIEDICFIANKDGVDIDADFATVKGCRFKLGDHDPTIDVDADDVLLHRNILVGADGIEIDGDRATVTENEIRNTDDNECIDFTGISLDAVVTHNLLEECDGDAISNDAGGNNATISHNIIRNLPDDADGIDWDGNNVTIYGNMITSGDDNGIRFNGDDSTIDGNFIEQISGDDNSDAGIAVTGEDNLITHNTTRLNGYAGILNTNGDRNTYRENVSEKNGRAGIRIQDGTDNIVDDNTLFDNDGEGINNGGRGTAINTVITDNTSLSNRSDVCNDTAGPSSIAVFTGNAFVTGGVATDCVVN
jgi:parallel beta-helix repeat protein